MLAMARLQHRLLTIWVTLQYDKQKCLRQVLFIGILTKAYFVETAGIEIQVRQPESPFKP